MNSLLKGIETSIKNAIEEFSKIISEKYDIEALDLENIWNKVSSDITISIVIKNDIKNTKNVKEKTSPKSAEKTENKSEDGCPYIYTRGENKGEQCGGKTKEGVVYCSRHKKFEEVGQMEKKKMPQAKTISAKAGPKKTSPPKKQIDKTLRMNKEINKFWHPESELIFKSKDERVVIGSYKNKTINKLSDDDIMLCEQYGFKYIKEEIVDDEESEDEEQDKEEQDKEEQDKEEQEKKKLEEKKEQEKKKLEEKKEQEKKKLEEKKEQEKKKLEEKKEQEKKEQEKKKLEEKKEQEKKKLEEKKKPDLEKKKISIAVNDIESVLNELQVDKNDYDFDDDDFVEEVEDEDLLDEED
jgi:hypothetical protein